MSDDEATGFGVVTRDVAMDPAISPTAKAVYLALAVHRDFATSECFPSVETLARGLNVTTRTVQRALVELAQAHVIRSQARFRGGRQTTNRYRLTDAIARRVRGVAYRTEP